jgi:hypothetical protein
VKRYDDPALPLTRKISLIEPAEHCDRLRWGAARASTHAVISPGCGEEARSHHPQPLRFDLDPAQSITNGKRNL